MMTRLRSPNAWAASRCDTKPRKFRSREHTCKIDSAAVSSSNLAQTAKLPMRALARGPSAMFTISTPPASNSLTCCLVLLRSTPGGAVSSTETTNSPRARRAPKRERSASGIAGCKLGAGVGELISMTGSGIAIAAVSPLACIMRTAPSMARVCAGVVPQHPPIICTPLLSKRRANTPKCSALATYSVRPSTDAGKPALG